jgi:hypothetical protein
MLNVSNMRTLPIDGKRVLRRRYIDCRPGGPAGAPIPWPCDTRRNDSVISASVGGTIFGQHDLLIRAEGSHIVGMPATSGTITTIEQLLSLPEAHRRHGLLDGVGCTPFSSGS